MLSTWKLTFIRIIFICTIFRILTSSNIVRKKKKILQDSIWCDIYKNRPIFWGPGSTMRSLHNVNLLYLILFMANQLNLS